MSEILLTEDAKHYLLSGNSVSETVTVTVSETEINVIIRFAVPEKPVESHVVAHSTTVDNVNYNIAVNQILHYSHSHDSGTCDFEEQSEEQRKEIAHQFISKIDGCLELVGQRQEREESDISNSILGTRKGLQEILDYLS